MGMGSLFTGRRLNIASCLPVYGRLCFALLNRKLQANLYLQDEKPVCPSSWCLHDLDAMTQVILDQQKVGKMASMAYCEECVWPIVCVCEGGLPNGLEVRRLPRRGDPDLRLAY